MWIYTKRLLIVALSVVGCRALAGDKIARDAAPADLDRYNVIWESPSEDAAGSMPIGNGENVLNVWVEDKTGDLLILMGRTDSMSEISRVLKLGRIRVHFDQGPRADADFKQKLNLRDGQITIHDNGHDLKLFVDTDADVIHLTGKFSAPTTVTATLEDWRDQARPLPPSEGGSAWSAQGAPVPLVEAADVFPAREGSVNWYHRNESSIVPTLWKEQTLTGLKGAFDPLIHRTFGGRISGLGMQAGKGQTLRTGQPTTTLDLQIATASKQTDTEQQWLELVDRVAKSSPTGKAESRTTAWWHSFWNRSWLFVSNTPEAEAITRGYVLQRYVQACQGRGLYPIKFNGGFYTVEPTAMGIHSNPDFRNWGDSEWYQNVRHMYHPMLEQGDFDMMAPFFRLYENVRQLAESRTEEYHGAKGAYFPETMTVYGTYAGGDYGWDRKGLSPKDVQSPWWRYAWNQGPELVGLMLDRYEFTQDAHFLNAELLPMADSVLEYFDSRFKKDSNGKIVLDPTQCIETYWTGVINDMPSTAGLRSISSRLCELPDNVVSAQRKAFYRHVRDACPDLPLQSVDGLAELAPAQKYDPKTTNSENGQLYAVWPFRVVSIAHPQLIEEAKRAYAHRLFHLDVGWGYDGNVAALLGMTDEASRILVVKCHNSHKGYRWPATWGPNYDWLPDQNHGGNLLNTANLMLLQGDDLAEGGAIRLLPAWPKDWDVDFRLHAPGNTVVHCATKAGKIVTLEVTPAARAKDVVVDSTWR